MQGTGAKHSVFLRSVLVNLRWWETAAQGLYCMELRALGMAHEEQGTSSGILLVLHGLQVLLQGI